VTVSGQLAAVHEPADGGHLVGSPYLPLSRLGADGARVGGPSSRSAGRSSRGKFQVRDAEKRERRVVESGGSAEFTVEQHARSREISGSWSRRDVPPLKSLGWSSPIAVCGRRNIFDPPRRNMSGHVSFGFEPVGLMPGSVAGRISVECHSRSLECESGTVVTFYPGERHVLRAPSDTRLLLLPTPWPGATHDSLRMSAADEILVTRSSRRSGWPAGGGQRPEGASVLQSADHPGHGIRRRIALNTLRVAANGAG
jgi:hypothetical protein